MSHGDSLCVLDPLIHLEGAAVCPEQLSMLHLLWPPYVIGQAIIFLPCDFYLLLLSIFFSPNLSGQRLDVYHTSAHGVALVQI